MKYVLITGAYGGMGRATAQLLAQNGFCVFAVDKTVGKEEENIIPIQIDVTAHESVQLALEKVKSYTSELYAIIHFAGIYMLDSLVEMSNEAFDKIFDVNIKGVFLVNKAFLPVFIPIL